MERQGKFDQEIRKKMLPLEDEPSAAVWAGIRSEIGLAIPAATRPWVFQVMVAASVALLVGLAFMLVQKNQRDMKEVAKVKEQVVPPAPRPQIRNRNYASQPESRPELNQPAHQPWYGPAHPKAPPENLAEVDSGQSLPKLRNQPEIKEQPQQLVEQKPRKDKENPLPEMAPSPKVDQQEAFTDNETPQNGKKRNLRLPKAEDLTIENLKNKSKGILASLAGGAGDLLGIKTQSEHDETSDLRTTAFSANLGLFKVKKVQTVKTKNP